MRRDGSWYRIGVRKESLKARKLRRGVECNGDLVVSGRRALSRRKLRRPLHERCLREGMTAARTHVLLLESDAALPLSGKRHMQNVICHDTSVLLLLYK